MYQIMVDSETLALHENAVIAQIAFVMFDANFNIINELDVKIDITHSLLDGFEVDPGTAHKFWAKQDKKVIEDVLLSQPRLTPKNAAKVIDKWFKANVDGDFSVWANGILFDVPKVDRFLLRYGFKSMTARTRYNLVYDFRTLRAAAKQIAPDLYAAAEKTYTNATLHNALSDCYWQINMLKAVMSILSAPYQIAAVNEAEPATVEVKTETPNTFELEPMTPVAGVAEASTEMLTEEKTWEDEDNSLDSDGFLQHVYGRTGKDA